jgi:hypothetical protein
MILRGFESEEEVIKDVVIVEAINEEPTLNEGIIEGKREVPTGVAVAAEAELQAEEESVRQQKIQEEIEKDIVWKEAKIRQLAVKAQESLKAELADSLEAEMDHKAVLEGKKRKSMRLLLARVRKKGKIEKELEEVTRLLSTL